MSGDNHIEKNAKPAPGNGKFLGCGGCVWAVVGGFLLLFVAALFLPTVSSCHEAARRCQCMNNLKHISLALLNYEQKYGCFPPAYTVDENGRTMHSWRALILPFMEDVDEHIVYDYDKPWNSPGNIAFANQSKHYSTFYCPTECKDEIPRRDTSYVILVGPHAFGNVDPPRKLADITDGTSNTIMVAEMSHSGIFWTEPRDLNVSEMSETLNDLHQIGLRSKHSDGLYAAFCDGHSEYLVESMPHKLLKALITIDGNENMEDFNNRDY